MNRINLITLGVNDLNKSLTFYRDGLGFESAVEDDIVFFNCNGSKLALYPLQALAKDIDKSNPPAGHGFSGITLAYNCKSKEEVDEIFAKAVSAGGTVVKKPQTASWGGYSGYFKDFDGYYWEIAYSEQFRFDGSDMLIF